MKYLLLLILAVGGYYAYSHGYFSQQSADINDYDLNALADKPMPKAVLMTAVRERAEKLCRNDDFLRSVSASQSTCMTRVADYDSRCRERVLGRMPDLLHSRAEMKEYTKQYLNCVLP